MLIKNNKYLYTNFINQLSKKKFFLIKIFCNLIFQILIAYIVLLYSENKNLIYSRIHFIMIIIALFIIMFMIHFIKLLFIKFILFCIFSGLVGLLFSYKFNLKNKEETEISKKAFITTICIFIYIVLFSFFLIYIGVKIPYQFGIVLFILLLIIIIIFIKSITGKYKYYKIISGFIIFVFSLFIAYDTIRIMDRNYDGDFITASTDYFLDLINIFADLSN